jgi:hypothetical protein
MARVKVCGECWKPVAECICDDEAAPDDDEEDGAA